MVGELLPAGRRPGARAPGAGRLGGRAARAPARGATCRAWLRRPWRWPISMRRACPDPGECAAGKLEAAIDWLRAQPGVTHGRSAVFGVSKGGEVALLMASRDPRHLRGGGRRALERGLGRASTWPTHPGPGPSWTLGGKPLAFVPYAAGAVPRRADLYERSLRKAAPDAAIPVEKINGPVLLISGKADKLWPSTPMADAVMARLDANHFAYPHTPPGLRQRRPRRVRAAPAGRQSEHGAPGGPGRHAGGQPGGARRRLAQDAGLPRPGLRREELRADAPRAWAW